MRRAIADEDAEPTLQDLIYVLAIAQEARRVDAHSARLGFSVGVLAQRPWRLGLRRVFCPWDADVLQP